MRALGRRLVAVDKTGGARWRARPDPEEARLERLTPDECARAARVKDRLDAAALPGIPDADIDFLACLTERLAGDRDEPSCADGSEP